MNDVAVVAEQVPAGVGIGADDGDRRQVRLEWQRSVVGEQDDRVARDLSGQLAVQLIWQRSAGRLHVRVLEQAEFELGAEHPPDGHVHRRLVNTPVGEGPGERFAEGPRGGKLDIQTRLQGHHGGLGEILGDGVRGQQLVDAEVIRYDDALEAPALAQDLRQELARRHARDPVDFVVGVHHRAQAGAADGGLEREEELVV